MDEIMMGHVSQLKARLVSLEQLVISLQAENAFLKGQVAGLLKSMGEMNERMAMERQELKRLRWVVADRLDGEEYDDLQE
jgi:hypothetical protein